MSEALVLREQRNSTTILKLNRPECGNALNPALIHELTNALAETGRDPKCRAVILTGTDNAFCSGLDMEFRAKTIDRSEEEYFADARLFLQLLRTIRELPQPVIAAVNGAAIACGTGLATVCDFTLAVPEAKFGFTEVRVGFIPAINASLLLRMVGEKQVRELLLTGRSFSSEEALRLGLITWVVKPEQLMDEALALAASLALNCPSSMAGVKTLLASLEQDPLEKEMNISVPASVKQRQHPDFKEGVLAFLMKRKPNWQRA